MPARFETLLPCAAAICAMGLAISSAQATSPRDTVRVWRKAHEKAIVADFVTLLSMPNVATNVADVEKNAAYIEGQLEDAGLRDPPPDRRARHAAFGLRRDEGPGRKATGALLRTL